MREARMVASLLEIQGVVCEIITARTRGDSRKQPPRGGVFPPGLFTHEVEVALAKNRADLAVHSVKDLPLELRAGLTIGAIVERDDPRDVLVANRVTLADSLESLPAGSRVGTSTVARRAQLLAFRDDLEAVELTGDVVERLEKVEKGRAHAAVFAAASLIRIGAIRSITQYLDPPLWLPRPGQGTLAIEIREDDNEVRDVIASLHHEPTAAAVRAERALYASLEGLPQLPVAALAHHDAAGDLSLHAFVSNSRGREPVRGSVAVDPLDPEEGGRRLAADLRSRGAESLIVELRSSAE
jgi:hydroxymethylbilane synthase